MDQVSSRVAFQNGELDDLIIANSNGVPTQNFDITLWLVGQRRVVLRLDHAIGIITACANASH